MDETSGDVYFLLPNRTCRPPEISLGFPSRTGSHVELLLVFSTSIGFKPGDFMTIGMNEERIMAALRTE
jgi:hypothetical protein